MSFMQPQIQHGLWWIIDGNCGLDVVPSDLCDTAGWEVGETIHESDESNLFTLRLLTLSQYTENTTVYSIELRQGFGARLSAPGYMDCTPWSVHETEEEAKQFLEEMYGDDDQPNDSMDGDHDSAMASAGLGTDEDYGGGDEHI